MPADKEVVVNISGKVVDEQDQPVKNASVKVGGSSTQTNELGNFSFSNVKIMQRNGFIQIEKEGFFKGLKTMNIDPAQENKLEIKLLKRTLTATFDASAGGTVSTDGDSKIIFEPGSVVKDADKTPYTGKVNIYAKYLNPTAGDFLKTMPGNLVGVTGSEEEVQLISFGMLNVEMETETGEKLQLAQGKPATISSEIPDELLGQAQATIPLWYMDEKDGLWKEEGIASKDGNRFSGKVSHFSFWNYDYYSRQGLPLYKIKARFVNKNNAPVMYKKFSISTHSVMHQENLTDSTGLINFMGSRDSMLITLWLTPCNNNTAIFKVGPFTEDTDLGNLVVDDTSQTNILKGKLAVCDSRVLKNGGLLYLYNGTNYLQKANIDSSGKFMVAEGETCLTDKPSIQFRFYNSEFILLKDTAMAFPKGVKDIGSIQSCRQNKPPVVNAGNDQEVSVGAQVYLSATASDPDGRISSYLWQKVSGPSGDVISQPASMSTNVSFINEGTYVYRITVTDNEDATASDEVSIRVNAASATDSSTIKVTIDTTVYNIAAPVDKTEASRSGTTTSISGTTKNYNFGNSKYASVSFSFSGNASPGTYNTPGGFINAGAEAYIIKEGSTEVSVYGQANQFVEGIFTGKVIRAVDTSKTNPATIPASVVFKAIRKQ
ncbi:MAG: carboxypeptidase regulatory-like domain-containing protein [Chitinophagaceae bacterium]|nr:carboxypeptidase regulatory-like domain-containing protein [Chitinophagaceae bacterium]